MRRVEQRDASTIMSGCVRLLGLDGVRERLGAQWNDYAERAGLIARQVLDECLGAGDIYREIGEGTFQICFESGDEGRARAQVERISVAIEQRIAAQLSEAGVSVESFVAPVSREQVRNANDPFSALYASLLEIRDAVNGRAADRHSIPALRYASALFQPLWANRPDGYTMNRCLLDMISGAAALKHLEEIEDLDAMVAALANLDCMLFAKAIEALYTTLGEAKRATLVIPVHFQTLATEHREFLDLAATLPVPYRRLVLLDIIGIPAAATAPQIAEALKLGQSITDRVIVQLAPTDYRLDPTILGMIWGVSVDLARVDSDDSLLVQDLGSFAAAASELHLFSLAYGANTIGKSANVVGAGCDYIGGTAVAHTTPVPRAHSRFKPLFGDGASRPSQSERIKALREYPRSAPVDPHTTVTLRTGEKFACRVSNISASGAAVICGATVTVHEYLAIGSIPSQVVRLTENGFAARFLDLQHHVALEAAPQTPLANNDITRIPTH
jgi:hypothetical protein